ncbi:hypothetical protein QE152_g33467 [Popillia japonica]|uniref:Uncharacterized protein n=1 Tax=Popillia japonica TaxID=7064 RepID=A0AAW1IXH7_POPJA
MHKEIWATYFHMGSTDKNPQHQNCPVGADSWCAYRRAEADGLNMRKFKHDYLPLEPQVLKVLHPIYTDLTRMEADAKEATIIMKVLTACYGTLLRNIFTAA